VKAKKFTTRDVVKYEFKDRIDEIIKEDLSYDKSHKKWLSLYPKAVTEVISELVDEEQAHVEVLVEEWNTLHPPSMVQAQ
jgi:hypothetical protein